MPLEPGSRRPDRLSGGGQILQMGAREEARRLQSIIDSGRDPRLVKSEVTAVDQAARKALKDRFRLIG